MSYLALASLYSRGLRPLAARAIFAFAAIARQRAIMLFASPEWVVPFPKRLWARSHNRFYENKDVMGTSTETSTDYPQECPLFSSEVLPDGSMAKSGRCFDSPVRFQETAKPREHGNLTIVVLRQGMYHHSPNAGMRPFMVVIFKVLRHGENLKEMLAGRIRHGNDPVFLNKCGEKITRKGITRILESIKARAVKCQPSLLEKHMTPHVIRHTTAMHLLKSGVDINTIRLWLGHVSIETTHGYAEADLDMKRNALAKNEISIPPFASRKYHPSRERLRFLENL